MEDVYEEDFDDIQLDLPARTFDDVAAEESLESLSKIQLRQISVGERFSCGITLLGSHLRCWGDTRKDHSSLERGLGQLPIYSPGPFRQVSVGPQGVCAIAGELEHLEEQRIRRESGFPELGEGDPVPHTDITAVTGISKRVQNQQRQQHKQHINLPVDSLACWGSAKDLVRPEPEDSWDQIYVGSSTICGVTMESELRCWGANVPHHLRDHHKSFVVA